MVNEKESGRVGEDRLSMGLRQHAHAQPADIPTKDVQRWYERPGYMQEAAIRAAIGVTCIRRLPDKLNAHKSQPDGAVVTADSHTRTASARCC